MGEMKHTPLPWTWEMHDVSMTSLGLKLSDGCIDLEHVVLATTRCKSCQSNPDRLRCLMPEDEDAEFILRAVNNHYQLIAVLEAVILVADRDTVVFDAARAAIAKAKGQ